MNKLPQKTFIIIILFYILAFIVFFSFSIFNFASINIVGETLTNPVAGELHMDISISRNKPASENQVLSGFKISWIFSNSIRLFISYLLPIQSTALIIAFSLIFPWKLGDQGMQMPFVDVIGKSIFLFLILTLVFTGLTEGILPGVLKKQSERLYLTEIAIDYFERADKELDSGKPHKDLNKISLLLKAYLQIDPKNSVVKDAFDWAEGSKGIKTVASEPVRDSKLVNEENKNKAADIIDKANEYFRNEDYFSALYNADLAFKLDPSRQDAQRLAAESREAIRSLEPDRSEKEAKIYFERKREGFNKLEEGDSIGAYYIFKELSESSAEDGDIQEFLERSLKKISEISFFIDEAEQYTTLPGIDDIVFLEDDLTLIHIDKMIILKEEKAFFFGIEVITIDKTGEISRYFKAPYGKFVSGSNSNSIIMHAIDRENSNLSIKPEYLIGTPGSPEDIILRLTPKLEELVYLTQVTNSSKFMNVLELFHFASIYNNYGYIKEPAQITLLERILKPFTFLIVSFISVSFGWMLRIRKYTFPWLAFLLVPAIPFLINNILSIYEYSMELVLGFSLFKTGFYMALTILLVSQAIILFLTLVSIASQRE
jgi:hypothetical protein